MNSNAVEHILELIDQLPEDDLQLLEQRLLERAEIQWRAEADQARRDAADRGIDQAAIDGAVEAARYGR